MNCWIGTEYHGGNRVLILAESWYGDEEPLSDYILRWAAGDQQDTLFASIYNALSGRRRERSTPIERLDWWQSVAFYNFVPGSLGATNEQRPTDAQFRASCDPLANALKFIDPSGVWLLGLGHAEYSRPVVESFGSVHRAVRHPRSGVSAKALKTSWDLLNAEAAIAKKPRA